MRKQYKKFSSEEKKYGGNTGTCYIFLELLRGNIYTGRPTGSAGFIDMLEKLLGRRLKHQKPGRKRRNT